MKKWVFVFTLLAQLGYSHLVEMKGAYFLFQSDRIQRLYEKAGWDISLAYSTPSWHGLQLYLAADYMQRRGAASVSGIERFPIIEIVPLSFGLKPVYPVNSVFEVYATFGPRYFFVIQHNRPDPIFRKSGCGGFVNVGMLFNCHSNLVLDFFAEYSAKQLDLSGGEALIFGAKEKLNAFVFGSGLGYRF